MAFTLTDRFIRNACDEACYKDAHVARAIERFGYPRSRRQDPGFGALLRIIVGQQLSTKAAHTIYGRLHAAIGEEQPSPERLLRLRSQTLQRAGLSRAKAEYCRALARAVIDGHLQLESLSNLGDAEVAAQLTAIKGFGLWSAQMYLMFSLGRPDIWPSGDLGIRAGVQHIMHLPERPTPKETEALVAHLAPKRSVIALLAWAAINAVPND